MKVSGIDVGSRYIKFVTLDGRSITSRHKVDTGYDPLAQCTELLDLANPDVVVATGYGRHLVASQRDIRTITEIKAVAKGARALFPTCRTIIDIGGQDTKVVKLNEKGNVTTFEMNDRCAAGTGKFLEIMARALGYDVESFGSHCGNGDKQVLINSLCTVFAESEVVGLISKGARREAISAAIHRSVVNRVAGMASRVGVVPDVVFTGGCARNPCLRELLGEKLGQDVKVSDDPDILSAYGAALCADHPQGLGGTLSSVGPS